MSAIFPESSFIAALRRLPLEFLESEGVNVRTAGKNGEVREEGRRGEEGGTLRRTSGWVTVWEDLDVRVKTEKTSLRPKVRGRDGGAR